MNEVQVAEVMLFAESLALATADARQAFIETGGKGEDMLAAERRVDAADDALRDYLKALSVPVVPAFTDVAARKLQELQERGYTVTGYALERPVEGGQPERGFINAGGFVGWWRGEHQVDIKVTVQPPLKSIKVNSILTREEVPESNSLSSVVLSNAAMQHQLSSDKEAGIFGRLQHVAQARKDCPICKGDSGYHRAVPVDGTLPTGNPNVPMTAQYVACARCDGADGVPLDGAHWHREPVFPIGYETQPANGQRIAGLNDQRQNEPQIIPKTISAPLADHIAARGNMVDVKASIGNLTASNLFKLKLLGYEVFQTLSGALTIHKLPDPVSGFGMEGKSWFAVGTFESELGRFVAASYAEAQELALNAFGRAAIPVSERLPEHRQEVLFKVEDLDANGQPKEYGNHGRWLGGRFTLDREFNMHSFSTPGIGWVASHWLPMPPQCMSEGGA